LVVDAFVELEENQNEVNIPSRPESWGVKVRISLGLLKSEN